MKNKNPLPVTGRLTWADTLILESRPGHGNRSPAVRARFLLAITKQPFGGPESARRGAGAGGAAPGGTPRSGPVGPVGVVPAEPVDAEPGGAVGGVVAWQGIAPPESAGTAWRPGRERSHGRTGAGCRRRWSWASRRGPGTAGHRGGPADRDPVGAVGAAAAQAAGDDRRRTGGRGHRRHGRRPRGDVVRDRAVLMGTRSFRNGDAYGSGDRAAAAARRTGGEAGPPDSLLSLT